MGGAVFPPYCLAWGQTMIKFDKQSAWRTMEISDIVQEAAIKTISKKNKKAFLSDRYKEIEENNRMGKTRDLFKKIKDTKGTFHAKMDRNGIDLTEEEDIKKRCQEYTEELSKKSFTTQIIMMVWSIT